MKYDPATGKGTWMLGRRLGLVTVVAATMLGCAHSPIRQTQSQTADALSWLVGEWRGDRFEPSTGDRAPVVSVVRSILAGAGEEESLEIKTSKGTYHGFYV